MSTDTHRQDYKPPPPNLEEGYWESLLSEGEFTDTTQPEIDYITPQATHQHHTTESETYQEYDNWEEIEEDWLKIQEIADQDNVIELSVTGYNRGGLLVEWRSLRGFVPASQLINFPSTASITTRRNSLIDRIGTSLKLRIIELSSDKNRLILSERAALAAPGERDEILQGLDPGEIVEGIVTNLCDFGAFIDLGGLEGLIHVSELAEGHFLHPRNVVNEGQTVQARILSINGDQRRLGLSLRLNS